MTAPALRIQTFGVFRVWRGAVEVRPSEWQRENARRLFQLFVTERGRFLPRERVCDLLWPMLDVDQAGSHFKVALYALNNTLEPDRPARAPTTFIIRREMTYGLDPEADVWLDAAEFERLVIAANRAERNSAEQAVELYRAAVDLYVGDYLIDALYEDWSSAERERLQLMFLSTATTLADLLVRRGQEREAIRLAARVLQMDDCWEEAYRLLMVAYARRGNRPQALRTFERCYETLSTELGVAPMPQTIMLAERIRTLTDLPALEALL